MSFESMRPERNPAGPKTERQAYIEMGGSFAAPDEPIEYESGDVYESLRDKATLKAAMIPPQMMADPSKTFASAEQAIQVPDDFSISKTEVPMNAEMSFMSKIKGWFKRPETVDDRTLMERLAEEEAEEVERILQSVRDRLESDPASLTPQEIAMLSDEEMSRFARWKAQQSSLVQH